MENSIDAKIQRVLETKQAFVEAYADLDKALDVVAKAILTPKVEPFSETARKLIAAKIKSMQSETVAKSVDNPQTAEKPVENPKMATNMRQEMVAAIIEQYKVLAEMAKCATDTATKLEIIDRQTNILSRLVALNLI